MNNFNVNDILDILKGEKTAANIGVVWDENSVSRSVQLFWGLGAVVIFAAIWYYKRK